MMLKKLNIKLTIIYSLIIITTILLLNFTLLYTYEKGEFDKKESKYKSYAQIMADLINDDLDNIIDLNGAVKNYSKNIDGRVLIVNENSTVLADKFIGYVGYTLSNKEINDAINNNNQAVGYYFENNRHIMMVTTPLISNGEIKGVVLISTNVDVLYKSISDLRVKAWTIAIISCSLAIILSLILGKKITRPVEELNKAAEKIQKGVLNTKVNIQRNDEIGTLAKTFNKMSEELYKIDSNRLQFISDISHELRTPLSSIRAIIEGLINARNDISCKEYLEDVLEEIDRLSLLVRSLLVVRRLDECELEKSEIKLFDEVSKVHKFFKVKLSEKNITLHNNCAQDIKIYCDKNRFREVLINLIDNGIKYGNIDGFIKISTLFKHDRIELIIQDNGIGISPKKIPYIFDNFYRVDESRTRNTGGNGIGLFIVKRIIESHDWSINVHSNLNEGTKFIISINTY